MNDAAMIADPGQSNPTSGDTPGVSAPDIVSDLSLAPDHRAYLNSAAITDAILDAAGVISLAPGTPGGGIAFPWHDGNGQRAYQFRPDTPPADGPKYIWPKDKSTFLWKLRDPGDGPVVFVEGTKQALAVASWAPTDFAVYGMAGCWGWSKAQLGFAYGRVVYVLLDGDAATNLDVYTAGETLAERLNVEGAADVLFARLPVTGKDGADDYLASLDPDQRTERLSTLVQRAEPKPAKRRPAGKRAKTDFHAPDGSLLAEKLAFAIMDDTPALISLEGQPAFYADGVYVARKDGLASRMVHHLGDAHRSGQVETVRQVLTAHLDHMGRVETELSAEPIICVNNGMLDLRTGQLSPHGPEWMATHKVLCDYDPDCPTPVYDQWCRDVGISDQLEALEELTATLLDRTRYPTRAMFLYGPSRSGKGTWSRLMKAIVGQRFCSALSLHDLSDDKFASANLYGKLLNVGADLSADEVKDTSKFLQATGEDLVHANRKYGSEFDFMNTALFVFIANAVPPINNASKAFINRVVPFEFAVTFEDHVDDRWEAAMVGQELPGILAKWVAAWQRAKARGRLADAKPEVMAHFVQATDQVAQWAAECLTVYAGQLAEANNLGADQVLFPERFATTGRDAYLSYKRWAEENGRGVIGKQAFLARIRNVAGVREVRTGPNKAKALNVRIAGIGDGPQLLAINP